MLGYINKEDNVYTSRTPLLEANERSLVGRGLVGAIALETAMLSDMDYNTGDISRQIDQI